MWEWIQLPEDDRRAILEDAALRTQLPAAVLEKDAWVTLLLEALYALPGISEHLLFKGGTSLSKAYGLIDRFSEDIDFALDRRLLGDEFTGELSKTKINTKLRPASAKFVRETLMPRLHQQLLNMGVPTAEFTIVPKADVEPDADPLPLYVNYNPVVAGGGYMLPRVEIEAGFRSLMEPTETRSVTSIISTLYPDSVFAGAPFPLQTVRPDRTFLEKVFLLHEQYLKPNEKALPRNRMSRHLYDLERLMDTVYATEAMANMGLYDDIIEHRKKFTPEGGVSYDLHGPATVTIVPPAPMQASWEADYNALTQNMTTGSASLPFAELLEKLAQLQERFRSLPAA